MNRIQIVFFCFCLFFGVASAQTVSFIEEPQVHTKLKEFEYNARSVKKIMGWRVQFYSTTDRRNMEQIIRKLKNKYPNIKFSWTYNEPFYQIKAGAFAYRKDTAPLQHLLRKEFAGAFPVQEEIETVELLENY
jgi:hypothetical protein